MNQETSGNTGHESPKSREYFRDKAMALGRKTLDNILALWQLVVEARKQLPHDEYLKFIANDLPFGYSWLCKQVRAAKNSRINDPKYRDKLPQSLNTLCEIAQLGEEAFRAGLERGIIHREAEWKDIKALRVEFDPELIAKRKKKATARVQAATVSPLRQTQSRTQSAAQAAARSAPTGPDVFWARKTESTTSPTEVDGLPVVEHGASPAAATAAAKAPSFEAPLPASVPFLNRIVAYVTAEVSEDQRNALLADLRGLKSKHTFIEAIQVIVSDGE